MNPRYTLIAVLAFVALLVFAYTLRDTESRQVGPGAPTPTASPLLELDGADVQEAEVVGPEGIYTLKRVGTGWEVDDQPASAEVDSVVSSMASPTVLRELPGGRNPDDYGFATPSLTVTLKTAAGADSVLIFGDDAPADPQVYVMIQGGDRIVLVSNYDVDRLKEWLDEPPLAPTATPTGDATGTAAAETAVGADEGEGDGTPDSGEDASDATPSPEGGTVVTGDATPGDTESAPTSGPGDASATATETVAPTAMPTATATSA